MSVTDESTTFGRARLSFASEADIDEFVATLERYERGEMTPDQWRAFRLVRGTYGQRQAVDAQMLRVKIPQGVLTGDQLDALADVGERYSRGFGHITTRQNIQFHFVKLHDVEPAMRRLAEAGLTTREACGNSVRNITACPYAGVAADERFDVTPYAEAMTRYLLRHPLSSTLPRKFKIAFEGCPDDHVADGDQRSRVPRGARAGRRSRGFRVTAGGGTAIMCRRRRAVLHEFLPASRDLPRGRSGAPRVPPVRRLQAQAAQPHEVHDQVARVGCAGARNTSARSPPAALRGAVPTLDIDPPAVEAQPDWARRGVAVGRLRRRARRRAGRSNGPGLTPAIVPVLQTRATRRTRAGATTNVRPQKQFGYAIGDGDGAARRLHAASRCACSAELARAYGDGTRARHAGSGSRVPLGRRAATCAELYRRLAAAGLGLAGRGDRRRRGELPGRRDRAGSR